MPHRAERHRQERDGNLLARRQQHVHLTRIMVRILVYAARQLDEIIGRVSHGGDDDDDLVLGLHAVEDTPRHRFDFFRSGNRAAAKLLYDQSHNFLLDCPSTRKMSRAKMSFENGHSLRNLKK